MCVREILIRNFESTKLAILSILAILYMQFHYVDSSGYKPVLAEKKNTGKARSISSLTLAKKAAGKIRYEQ